MSTIHLIYPHGDAISCPDAIGRKLAEGLATRHRVVLHDIDERQAITPGPDDVLLGHPDALPWTVFRRSAALPGWRRRLVIQPFCPGDARLQAWTDHVMPLCDQHLAICGRRWLEHTPATIFQHWAPKLIHLDLAVDRHDFPVVKRAFQPPGRRRFLYVGHAAWYKEPDYLCALARAFPQWEFGWIGTPKRRHTGPRHLGRLDFREPAARELVSRYDFLITVGSADANPTTILEAMAWGLIPVCTRESGYDARHEPGIINVPLHDVAGAGRILAGLQDRADGELRALQQLNWQRLDGHYHWDRFIAQVQAAIASDVSPPLLPRSTGERLAMRAWELRSRHSWVRLRPLKRLVRETLFPPRPVAPPQGGHRASTCR